MRTSRINFFALSLLLLLLCACDVTVGGGDSKQAVKLSGNTKTESRTVSGVRTVIFDMFGNLTVEQGTDEGLTIQADENLLPLITNDVNAGTLTLKTNGSYTLDANKENTLEITLKVKQLDALTLKGAGNVKVLKLDTQKLTVELDGAGNTTVEGKAADQEVALNGAGGYDGSKVEGQNATVSVAGAGTAKVRISSVLNANISGVGSIEYIGNPTLNKNVSGVGEVKQVAE